jgi:molybdopterin converting factor small subunit
MKNTIYNNNDELIGYYSDIAEGYKKEINEACARNDFDNASELIEQLKEINEYEDSEKLLILSNNNGMGFTVNEFKQ